MVYQILKDFGLPAYLAGIAILVSLAYKRIKEHQVRNLNSTKEQLDAITSLLSDKQRMKNRFLVEQVFNYKFKVYIPFSVIVILLEFNNPTKAIENWIIAKRHLAVKTNPVRFEYRARMASKNYRRNWIHVSILSYFIFSSLGLWILFCLPKLFVSIHYAWIIGSGVLIFYLLYIAYESLLSAQSIKAAEVIMEEFEAQEKHNKSHNKDIGVEAPTPVI